MKTFKVTRTIVETVVVETYEIDGAIKEATDYLNQNEWVTEDEYFTVRAH